MRKTNLAAASRSKPTISKKTHSLQTPPSPAKPPAQSSPTLPTENLTTTSNNKLPSISVKDFALQNQQSQKTRDPNVVQEIPVYFTRKLSPNIYLLQYPVRAKAHPYAEQEQPIETRIKPKSQQLEVDIPLDTNTAWYSKERGRDLALGVNNQKAKTIYDRYNEMDEDEDLFLLDRQTLHSTHVPQMAKYMIGYIKDGGFHLTPVDNIYQLRPGLKYLDVIKEKEQVAEKKAKAKEDGEDLMMQKIDDTINIEDEEPLANTNAKSKNKTVQISAKNVDPDPATVRKNAYSLVQRAAEEEKWIKLKYYFWKTDEASALYDKIKADQHNSNYLICKTSKEDYLKAICPPKPDLKRNLPAKQEQEEVVGNLID